MIPQDIILPPPPTGGDSANWIDWCLRVAVVLLTWYLARRTGVKKGMKIERMEHERAKTSAKSKPGSSGSVNVGGHGWFGVALLSLALFGCTTLSKLEQPGPPTPGDEAAFYAMVEHGLALMVKDEIDGASSWVDDVAAAYAALRFAAGDPIYPGPGETEVGAAFRGLIEEMVNEGVGILAEEPWAISAVRVYAGWRFATGDPIKPPPPHLPPLTIEGEGVQQ